jgi:hypothetical protein
MQVGVECVICDDAAEAKQKEAFFASFFMR